MTRHISNLGRNSMEGSKQFEAIYNSNKFEAKQFEAIYKGNKLRTILKCDDEIISLEMVDDLLCKFKCLHALSLYFPAKDIALPDSIGNLKHLRYLDLSSCGMKKLPDSTCSLYNLQTLKLKNCLHLGELPSCMHKLVNLRHLDLRETRVRKLPNGMRKLKKLEVLMDTFSVGKWGESNINLLGEFILHGKLSIEELQNVADPKNALRANLKNKIHLKELRLKWESSSQEMKDDGYGIEEDVLKNLQPPANLKELCIEYYNGTRFPDWLGNMSVNNIVSLRLIGCKYCVCLPPLGMLPSLKDLEISGLEGIKSIGAEFYGNNSSSSSSSSSTAPAPFRSLQYLTFKFMYGWEEWDCENTSSSSGTGSHLKTKLPQHFPSLMKLRIHGCPQLGLPKLFPTLKELFIANCPKLLASHSKWDLHTLPSLTQLTIKDEDGKYVDCKGWLSLPPNLEILNWKRLVVYDRQPFRYLR